LQRRRKAMPDQRYYEDASGYFRDLDVPVDALTERAMAADEAEAAT